MPDRPKLGQLLLRAGAIDEPQLAAALAEQSRWGSPLGATLVQMGFLDEEMLVRTLARQLQIPIAWLRGKRIRPEVLELVPRSLVERHRCLPLLVDQRGGRSILLAMADPADLEAVDEVAFHTGLKVRAVLAAPSELDDAIHRHYPTGLDSSVLNPLPQGESGSGRAGTPPEPELLSLGPATAETFEFGAVGTDLGDSAAFGHAPQAAAPSASGVDASGEPIVRALAQLLVEKGILSREELVERLSALAKADSGA